MENFIPILGIHVRERWLKYHNGCASNKTCIFRLRTPLQGYGTSYTIIKVEKNRKKEKKLLESMNHKRYKLIALSFKTNLHIEMICIHSHQILLPIPTTKDIGYLYRSLSSLCGSNQCFDVQSRAKFCIRNQCTCMQTLCIE